jgi:hypothetical protein
MSKERGASPIELALGLMLLVIPITILALSVAPVFEHRNFANRAAAEAARVLVLATGDAEAEALNAIEAQAAGLGIDPAAVRVTFCGGMGCSRARGSVVTVEVSVNIPQLSSFLPIGALTVRAIHAEQVDLYRSRP